MKNWILAFALLCFGSVHALADAQMNVSLDRGTYVETAAVAGTSVTGTAFASAAIKRMDGIYFNNTSSFIWIGTATATTQSDHANMTGGFPVLSSSTFSLDGLMSGSMTFTCSAGVAACQIRRLEGLNR